MPFYLLCAIAVGSWLYRTGRFTPVIYPDSLGYQWLAAHPAEWLSNNRTPLYPIFLRYVPLDFVTLTQYAVHSAAVIFLARSLPRARWMALPLLLTPIVSDFTGAILTEMLAESAILFVMALALRRAEWLLAFAIFLACLLRPVSVCLVPWCWLVGGWRCVAKAATPVLLFCTLRFFVVGDFALSSFSGIALSPYAGEAIDEQTAATLAPLDREIASAILGARAAAPTALHARFDWLAWSAAVPAARAAIERHPEFAPSLAYPVRCDRALRHFVGAVFVRRPLAFARQAALHFAHPKVLAIALVALLFFFAGKPGPVARLGAAFTVVNLVFVCVLSVPIERYAKAAIVFLPMLAFAAVGEKIISVFRRNSPA